jgi:hypothetical protein
MIIENSQNDTSKEGNLQRQKIENKKILKKKTIMINHL